MAAVLAAPEDDAPRLVLADWFAERGDARGELIHVGLALARPDLDRAQRGECERRYIELISGPGTAWLGELGLKSGQVHFNRGMVEGVSLPFAELEKVAERLCAATPLLQVRTWGLTNAAISRWASTRWPSQLRSLQLVGMKADALRNVLQVRPLNINHLGIDESPGAHAVVCQWDGLQTLARLSLVRCELGEASLTLLGEHVAHLLELDLTLNRIDAAAVQHLLRHPLRLRGLKLGSNPLQDAGALVLAESPHLRSLTDAQLDATHIGDTGAVSLVASRELRALRELDLSWNRVTDAGAQRLSELTPHLQFIDLYCNNGIGAAGDRALRAAFGSHVRV